MSTTAPVKGVSSPEYLAIQSHYGTLTNKLDCDKRTASAMLFELKFIERPQKIPGIKMMKYVLREIENDAIKFYSFLYVLHNLKDTKDIMEAIHGEFSRKTIML